MVLFLNKPLLSNHQLSIFLNFKLLHNYPKIGIFEIHKGIFIITEILEFLYGFPFVITPYYYLYES